MRRSINHRLIAMAASLLATASMGEVDHSQLADVEKRLERGDKSGIEQLRLSGRIGELYYLLNEAEWRRYGRESNQVFAAVRKTLASMPGHARFVGDKVEELTQQKGNHRKRESLLISLKRVGTPEAISQLGRFLYDERNPDFDPNQHYYAASPGPNFEAAAWGIMEIMKGNLPFKPEFPFNRRTDVEKVRDWWESSHGEPYRRLLDASGVGYAGTVPGTNNDTQGKLSANLNNEPNRDSSVHRVYWAVICGIAMVILLAAGKYRRRHYEN